MGCVMDYTASNDASGVEAYEEFAERYEASESGQASERIASNKKMRRPLRKNRKPSRPGSYIGQRTNKRLRRY